MQKTDMYLKEFTQRDIALSAHNYEDADLYAFFHENVPFFECSDKEVERIYYFRYFTYWKHLQQTKYGYVVTEFLPSVSWANAETNVINAAVAHHIAEGRWLKHADCYLLSYVNYILDNSSIGHLYSSWMLYALMQYDCLRGISVDKALVEKMDAYYRLWEKEHETETGLFFSIDSYDAMEMSISGHIDGKACRGLRPTLNSYMFADAVALQHFATRVGMLDLAKEYALKAEKLRSLINDSLWRDGFYRALHYKEGETASEGLSSLRHTPRELIGYIPFMFGIPPQERDPVMKLLSDRSVFLTDIGLTTAEQGDPNFLYETDHECMWNGYVWPFATAESLTALLYVAKRHPEDLFYTEQYYRLLRQYAASHKITLDGVTYPWIDEVLHPYTGDWSSRTYLKNRSWLRYGENHYERGRDYNHSTFCDLVLSALTGIDTSKAVPSFHPLIPEGWDYFKIENLSVRSNTYSLSYDKDGSHYGKKGFFVVSDNT